MQNVKIIIVRKVELHKYRVFMLGIYYLKNVFSENVFFKLKQQVSSFQGFLRGKVCLTLLQRIYKSGKNMCVMVSVAVFAFTCFLREIQHLK